LEQVLGHLNPGEWHATQIAQVSSCRHFPHSRPGDPLAYSRLSLPNAAALSSPSGNQRIAPRFPFCGLRSER
jgi:hypothetical protein